MSRNTREKETPFEVIWEDDKASTVEVTGFRGDWSQRLPLTRRNNGGWGLTLNLPPQIQKFKFLIDGLHWKISKKYAVDSQGNNIITMEDFVLNRFSGSLSLETGAKEGNGNSSNFHNSSKSLEKTIVCFFADGSEKYTPMTIHAIVTFLRTTPDVKVGLLTHDEETKKKVLNSVPENQRNRISSKLTRSDPYFSNWNPTQYKLDIQRFAEGEIEVVFWADSDCIFFQDLRPFLHRFVSSDKNFYLAFDHVMQDKEFVRRWEEQRPLTIVPQACLMGFKLPVIRDFFQLWEQIWRDWISPVPFAKYPDPRPHFQGSAFCIEQYAMGMALYNYSNQILIFGREIMAISVPIPSEMQALALGQLANGSANVSNSFALNYSGNFSGIFNFSQPIFEQFSGFSEFSGLQNFSGLFSGVENFSGLFSGLENFSGFQNFSGVFSGLENVSGLQNFSGAFSGLENFSGAYSGLYGYSGPFSGLENFSGFQNFSGIFSGLENFSGFQNFSGYQNYSGAGDVSGLYSGSQGLYSGYQLTPLKINGTPTLVFLSTHQSSTSVQDGVILIDKFGGSVLHCYNQTYELAKNWFDNQPQNQNN